MLAAGALLQGLSRAFYSGNNDALLHDTLREIGKQHQYHTHLGRTSAMYKVALAIASLAGGLMAGRSYALVMWASIVPQIGALIIALFLVESAVSPEGNIPMVVLLREALRQFKGNYRLRLLTASSALRYGLGESSYFLRSAFVYSIWPLWAVGISNMISNISGAVSFYFGGKIIDKYGSFRVLNFEIIFNRIINLTSLLFPSVASPALMGSTSLTYGVGSVAMNTLLQKEFTQHPNAPFVRTWV